MNLKLPRLRRGQHSRTEGVPVAFAEEATWLLHAMLGLNAAFRPGQLEAIYALVDQRSRLLVVQKTGWGKSLVYFIAARMLRDRGAGPTFLVSPLLSLMRNQQEMAARIGVRARSLNSTNQAAWQEIEQALAQNQCDVLMVSPERLGNERFRRGILPRIQRGVGMIVIDEAHCISDWGHDFRPDYRRIVQIVRTLPSSIPVLATTATANDRVVVDIQQQIGQDLAVLRGPLARPTLRLQAIQLAGQAERLAWLASHLPELPGTGIIYCLTKRDTELVAQWLTSSGINVVAYHGDMPSEIREERERRLLSNEVKALAATVALGMGYDKPDLGFVVHFQRPGSVVSYYQQIGRAGRTEQEAYAVLLNGQEDDDIQEYFINGAFPGADALTAVIGALSDSEGKTLGELQHHANLSHQRLEQCLKMLEVEGAIVRDDRVYQRTARPWRVNEKRFERITALRYRELERMREFVQSSSCLMEFIARELDDPTAAPCGRCANCAGAFVAQEADLGIVNAAARFMKRSWLPIESGNQLPAGVLSDLPRMIPADLGNEIGLALCSYADSGWGDAVRYGKHTAGRFDGRLVQAASEAITATWSIDTNTWWLTAVPSLRHPALVADFARLLAAELGIPFVPALVKRRETPEQKTMQNSVFQAGNVIGAFSVNRDAIKPGPVILVDDIVDSGWTLTLCGAYLRRADSGPVYPFTLASQQGG